MSVPDNVVKSLKELIELDNQMRVLNEKIRSTREKRNKLELLIIPEINRNNLSTTTLTFIKFAKRC